jgi:hypothetical protein
MVDRLRRFLNRPLRDGDRVRLFAIAAAAIAAGAAMLTLFDDAGPSRLAERTARPQPAFRSIGAAGSRTYPVALPDLAPSEEGLPTAAAKVSRAAVAAAKHAARRFLTGYLAFTYDHGPAGAIRGVSPALERELAAHPPRVPARERARRPHVRLLQTDGVSFTAASLLALVDDGARSHTLAVELAHIAGAWTVTRVGA